MRPRKPRPTHYWESSVSKRTYHQDNTACHSDEETGRPAAEFDPSSPSFQDYRACMIEKGYTLRTY